MNSSPLVSILINNYNYGHFLREAIDSALNQTYSHIEVIVVDDGSTDDSREIITSYRDKIIPLLKENGGQASAFNAGFAASRGDIICFLDSDDIFIPEKVAEVVDVFKRYQDIGWCFHSLQLLDNKTRKFIKNSHELASQECDFRADVERGSKLPYIPTATSGLCFTRSLMHQILPMPEAANVVISDNYLKFTALGLSQGYFLNKELAIQKIHGNNAYTCMKDKQLDARICLSTAYWIREQFPLFYKLANGLFITAIGIYWRSGGVDPESIQLVNSYLSSVRILKRIELQLRAVYHCIKYDLFVILGGGSHV